MSKLNVYSLVINDEYTLTQLFINKVKEEMWRTSLEVQWLKLRASNAGGAWVQSHMLCGVAKKLKKIF